MQPQTSTCQGVAQTCSDFHALPNAWKAWQVLKVFEKFSLFQKKWLQDFQMQKVLRSEATGEIR